MTTRARIFVQGVVQGVGFRPFIYRLATNSNLTGWVQNSSEGVTIEVEGPGSKIDDFISSISKERPENSFIENLHKESLEPIGFKNFKIHKSDTSKEKTTLVLPDIATCQKCLEEVFNPNNRRYLYPFTNCTHCGPRYSIIEALPYDRKNTSMKIFPMCPDCLSEYEDPLNRRFHAQPNACSICGPHVELRNNKGDLLATKHEAILDTAHALKKGQIVAIKGLGGFHLFVDAGNDTAVNELRKRKRREEKPFALMLPSLKTLCSISDVEKKLLTSRERPIVLLRKEAKTEVSTSVSPNNPYLGVMLPYTPLHHIVLSEFPFPVIATSGNLSDEPICIDEKEALERLGGIADLFLIHNRPIVRHVDDSIVRIFMDQPSVVRRARGYAPLPVIIRDPIPTVLAVGSHLKDTLSLSVKNKVFISQHIGDLETEQSFQAFQATEKSLRELYAPKITHIACDMHPEYLSSKFTSQQRLPVIKVQHHHAHIASCMVENHLEGQVLGISWDGTGWGTDRTLWGGEFLLTDLTNFTRVAHWKTFRLPGGEKGIREPRRAAIAILRETFQDHWLQYSDLPPLKAFTSSEISLLEKMLERRINCPTTSSLGRLFDAVASLLDLCQYTHYEGQAAMSVEYAIAKFAIDDGYSYEIEEGNPFILDWKPMIKEIIQEIHNKIPTGLIATKFHNTLVEMAINIAKRIKEPRVVLSGGCFQNVYLTTRLIRRLQKEGFEPYCHKQVPCNDGGISLGQVAIAANRIKRKSKCV